MYLIGGLGGALGRGGANLPLHTQHPHTITHITSINKLINYHVLVSGRLVLAGANLRQTILWITSKERAHAHTQETHAQVHAYARGHVEIVD